MSLNIKIEFHIHIHLKENEKKTLTDVDPLMSKAFCTLAEQHIESLRNQRTSSTIENYLTALRSFRSFLVHTKTIVPLNADIFEKYEHYLRDSNLKPNTTSCYMRSLRSLAIRILGDEARKMFCKVYTGRAITEKRSLPVEDFASLRSLTLKPGSSLALTRDLFLFSFYAMGMPFVDMAFLRRDQISNGRMTYYRHKTGQYISVKIEPCMHDIISRYELSDSDYVFPLLSSDDPVAAYEEYQLALNRYNRTLKRLAKKAGLVCKLTSYVARHSWASAAFSNNVDMPVISKALGHANPRNTLIYIRQLSDEQLSTANHRLLDLILK
jgi:integrase